MQMPFKVQAEPVLVTVEVRGESEHRRAAAAKPLEWRSYRTAAVIAAQDPEHEFARRWRRH